MLRSNLSSCWSTFGWLLHTVYVHYEIKEHPNDTPMAFFPLTSLHVSTIKAKIHCWIVHVKKSAPPFCCVQPRTAGGSCIQGFSSLYTMVLTISPAFKRCFLKFERKKIHKLHSHPACTSQLPQQLCSCGSSTFSPHLSLSRCRRLLCVEQWLMCRSGCVFSVLLVWCRVVWAQRKSSS